jgi:hypothetical protein
MIVLDKAGFARDSGYIVLDDILEVTSEDKSTTRIYTLKMLGEELNSEAFVTSELYQVSQDLFTIESIDPQTDIEVFMGNIVPAEGAFISLKDKDGVIKTTGDIIEGDQLVVLSEDLSKTVSYVLKVLGTSVEDLNNQGVSVYPNPVSDILVISGLDSESVISLIDITGQKVKVIKTNQSIYQMPFNDLKEGMYFIKVEDKENRSFNFRIVKK